MNDVSAQVPGIATSKGGAQAFVQRLVMQTVFDVLENQARSALIPDATIANILSQVEVKASYEPLQCLKFTANPLMDNVTGICNKKMMTNKCMNGASAEITPVPTNHTSISGTLTTSNIIMASWSRTMWQSVLNRALRMLALGPFRIALLLGIWHCLAEAENSR
ncbi:hypothetical protein KIN20_015921 [Parelaphostrongylus tenuis]|uniref:Uncharacterized protein n=1 Tax=Parelaphostrongylus tenuis TaxID=148309 RepID=A0AAD5MGS3_PARTN|nr:hypothetical protein KIN20_015921 [Parelaphostrongylus tenuis]